MSYQADLETHYATHFGQSQACHVWNKGRALPQPCTVLEYPPTEKTFCWVYATCGMTLAKQEGAALELFLLSPVQSQAHVELLTIIASYHQEAARLDWGHTVNIGRPWLENSRCDYGLLSLPYLFGPSLENGRAAGRDVRVLWFFPITEKERDFKAASGIEALEELFEKKQVDCLNPMRNSVVA